MVIPKETSTKKAAITIKYTLINYYRTCILSYGHPTLNFEGKDFKLIKDIKIKTYKYWIIKGIKLNHGCNNYTSKQIKSNILPHLIYKLYLNVGFQLKNPKINLNY